MKILEKWGEGDKTLYLGHHLWTTPPSQCDKKVLQVGGEKASFLSNFYILFVFFWLSMYFLLIFYFSKRFKNVTSLNIRQTNFSKTFKRKLIEIDKKKSWNKKKKVLMISRKFLTFSSFFLSCWVSFDLLMDKLFWCKFYYYWSDFRFMTRNLFK